MPDPTPVHIAISFHTHTDLSNVISLADALRDAGVAAEKLDYLTISGFSSQEGLGGGLLRRDAWIEHFTDILGRSAGMIVVQGEHTRPSQEYGGMWIEERLALQCAESDREFVRFVEAPPRDSPSEVAGSPSWAISVVRKLRSWIERRAQSGRSGLIRRFAAADFNSNQPYDIHEIQFAGSTRTWFHISVLDLYDRVWHCRRCLSASDVWEYPHSRPPARCPACGFAGGPVT